MNHRQECSIHDEADKGCIAGADKGSIASADKGSIAGADKGSIAGADKGSKAGADKGSIAGAMGNFVGGVISELQKPRQTHHEPCHRRGCQKEDERKDRIHSHLCHGRGCQKADDMKARIHLPIPYVRQTGPLRPNNIFFICGVPRPNAQRITINLQCGNDVIAFHFDVRFNFGSDRNVIVRNTKQGNGWGPPERFIPGGYFPFQPNMYFEVIILAEPHCFKVAVNNKHLLEFKHRIPLNRVNTLRINGEVKLTQVRFQE